MKHTQNIASCHLRAKASITQADFIAARCQEFRLVCPHTPSEDPFTGVLTPAIHVFQEDVAKQEFGYTDWTEVCRPENSAYRHDPQQFAKLVVFSKEDDLGFTLISHILVSYDKAIAKNKPEISPGLTCTVLAYA